MKVLVFGATGRTGQQIVAVLQAAGHDVVAWSRRPVTMAGVAPVTGDLRDAEALRRAARAADAVISALASDKGNPACSMLAEALLPLDGLRFVSIGGAGVDAPGDAKALSDRMVGWLMRRVAGEMLADRQREHDRLATSSLRWTMLRPPRLTAGAGTGRYRLTHDTPAGTSIARADLARAAVDLLDDTSAFGKAPFVAGVKR